LPKETLNGKNKEEKPQAPLPDRIIVLASEIEPTKIKWLWQGRIPLGMMTTFAGSGGLGKTFVLLDIVARVSKGTQWPDGVAGNAPGSVLYISGEDNPNDTLVPRLIALEGDRSKVGFFKPEVLGQFSLERIDMIEMALDQLGKDCRLICIDPPTSFLAGTDDHKNSELRELLTPISQLAARRNVAVVFITHINKGGGGKVDAVMRIIGSVAWSTAVRAAHMFCEDPNDPAQSLFLVAKINGAKKRKGIAYKIKQLDENEVDGLARVEWLGEVDTTANEAMSGSSKKVSRSECAAEWLVERFRIQLEWESEKLFANAKEEGISRNSIFDAKNNLGSGIRVKRNMRADGTNFYVWAVMPDWEKFTEKTPGHQDTRTPETESESF
jgi:hypothetical protein